MKTYTRRNFIRVSAIAGIGAGIGTGATWWLIAPPPAPENVLSVIINARIFNGTRLIEATSIVIDDGKIASVGGSIPSQAKVVNAQGATLMPGLINAHTHTDNEGLKTSLTFGVTTALDMNGHWSSNARLNVANNDELADIRAPGTGLTPPGGHPTQYQAESSNPLIKYYPYPTVATPKEATETVAKRVAEGADYIKIFLEDGEVTGYPGLTLMDDATLKAAVVATHSFGKLAIVHAATLETTTMAIAAGVDGLGHLFVDQAHTPEIISAIAESGAFVIPCLVLNSSVFGNNAADLAADPRVSSKLDEIWIDALNRSFNINPNGSLEDGFATIRALKEAGVDIMAGSDVAEPLLEFGGLAHGASLHHELQFLVKAGLTPIEALRAATSTPARRFGLTDRGRIAPGLRADMFLVDGDPLSNISDTLSIRAVWRRGAQLSL